MNPELPFAQALDFFVIAYLISVLLLLTIAQIGKDAIALLDEIND